MPSVLEYLCRGRFLIVFRVFGRSDSVNGPDEIIEPEFGSVGEGEGKREVNCRERLGGLLRYYHRDAA